MISSRLFRWFGFVALLWLLPEVGVSAEPSGSKRLLARTFNSGFDLDHDTWNGMGIGSDGKVYYVLCGESIDRGAQMFSFDPATEQIRHVGDLTEACGEKGLKAIPQGKSHATFVECDRKLYFATHLAYYSADAGKEKKAAPPPGYQPYPGGHFLAYDMARATFQRLASAPPGEGILAMNMDTQRRRLYGHTWPTGYFLRYDLAKQELKQFGPVAGQGEAGEGPTFSTLCRAIVIDPRDGSAYLTTSAGSILRYRCDRDTLETVSQENMRKDYFGTYDPAKPGHMGYNWRQAVWHPTENLVYGVHGNSGYLFRFDPLLERIVVLDRITSDPSKRSGMFDRFQYGYLGFTLGPDLRTLYYLTGGPFQPGEEPPPAKDKSKKIEENLHLVTYDIPTGRSIDHGAIYFADGQRPSRVHSIAVDKDGTVYALSRVARNGRSVPDLIRITLPAGALGSTSSPGTATSSPAVWRASAAAPPAVMHEANAEVPVQFAAAELRSYLGRILGAPVAEQGSGPVIRLHVQPDAGLGDEGFELRAEGTTYRITGGGPAGVVFGAYEFLRRFGGCRFSDLGPDGECVPRRTQIEVPGEPLRIRPQLWYRGLQFIYAENPPLARQRIDWMAKNGLNYVMFRPFWKESLNVDGTARFPWDGKGWPKEARITQEWFDRELLPEIRRRGLKLDMNLHNLLYWLPPGRYLDAHPEWYAMVGGKRGTHFEQLCICTSNPEAVAALVENVKGYLRAHREVKIVGVIPEDSIRMCQCQQCVAGDDDPKDAFRPGNRRAENPSKSRRYHKLLREVALAVRPEFPDILVGGAAYVDLYWPARDVELPENTNIWAAIYWRDGCRPIAAANTSTLNQGLHEVLQRWQQSYRGRLTVYEYYMGMSKQKSLPYPMSEVICADWSEYKRLGVQGAVVQCWTSEHSVYALNNLAFARAGWCDRVDHRQVLDEYLLGAFGSAAEPVRPIFEGMLHKIRDMAQSTVDLQPDGDNVVAFWDPESVRHARQALAAARHQASDDRERRQVAKLGLAVDYWAQAAAFLDLRAQATRLKESDPAQSAVLLRRAVHEEWPQLNNRIEALPPGWGGVLVPRMWDRVLAPMKEELARLP